MIATLYIGGLIAAIHNLLLGYKISFVVILYNFYGRYRMVNDASRKCWQVY
jgi:hypothetical protein